MQAHEDLHSKKMEYNPGASCHEATALTTAPTLHFQNFRPVGRKGTDPFSLSVLRGSVEFSTEDALSPFWRP